MVIKSVDSSFLASFFIFFPLSTPVPLRSALLVCFSARLVVRECAGLHADEEDEDAASDDDGDDDDDADAGPFKSWRRY